MARGGKKVDNGWGEPPSKARNKKQVEEEEAWGEGDENNEDGAWNADFMPMGDWDVPDDTPAPPPPPPPPAFGGGGKGKGGKGKTPFQDQSSRMSYQAAPPPPPSFGFVAPSDGPGFGNGLPGAFGGKTFGGGSKANGPPGAFGASTFGSLGGFGMPVPQTSPRNGGPGGGAPRARFAEMRSPGGPPASVPLDEWPGNTGGGGGGWDMPEETPHIPNNAGGYGKKKGKKNKNRDDDEDDNNNYNMNNTTSNGGWDTGWGGGGPPDPVDLGFDEEEAPPPPPPPAETGKKGKGKGKKGKNKNKNAEEEDAGPGGWDPPPKNENTGWGDWPGSDPAPPETSWGEPTALPTGGGRGGGRWGADPYPMPTPSNKPASKQYGSAILLDNGYDTPGAKNGKAVRIEDSGGKALESASRALYGKHRPADRRFLWILPYQHDSRVSWMFDWVQENTWALATYGFHKYLSSREKGALITNVDSFSEKHPSEPVFDWITFPEIQKTHDRTIQRSIAANNPATTCLVFIFLVSKSGNSLGMWRRKLNVPQTLQTSYKSQVRSVESDLRDKAISAPSDPGGVLAEAPLPAAPAGASEKEKEKKPGRLARWITWGGNENKKVKKAKS